MGFWLFTYRLVFHSSDTSSRDLHARVIDFGLLVPSGLESCGSDILIDTVCILPIRYLIPIVEKHETARRGRIICGNISENV